jgi:hypothetical protein
LVVPLAQRQIEGFFGVVQRAALTDLQRKRFVEEHCKLLVKDIAARLPAAIHLPGVDNTHSSRDGGQEEQLTDKAQMQNQ